MPSSAPPPFSERAMIEALRKRARRRAPGVRVGIGDDCALLRLPPGHELAVTTDLFLEATHFRRDWHSPEAAGHRCLARGLSDLAAVGAQPVAAFLSLAAPAPLAGRWVTRFLGGLLALADRLGVPLAGGDTAQAPGGDRALFTADIVLLGAVPEGKALLRSGARPGDRLYVTGALGGAAAELAAIAQGSPQTRRRRVAAAGHPHLFPEPRLAQGMRLRGLASAAIDLSDGLSTDLAHLCAASGVRAEIEAAHIPIHPLAEKLGDALGLALHGGEDYELLFTAPESARVPRAIRGVPLRCLGRIMRARKGASPITLLTQDGRREALPPQGWEHFRSTPAG